MKKKDYEEPTISFVELEQESQLLAGSDSESVLDTSYEEEII